MSTAATFYRTAPDVTGHVPHVLLRGVYHKSCARCASLKPAGHEHFHFDRATWDGLYSWCKVCCKEKR